MKRLYRRLLVAGVLAVAEAVGFAILMLQPRSDGFQVLGIIIAIGFVFGVPVAGIKIARHLVSEQTSNAPAYVVVAVNVLYAYYDLATEDTRMIVMTVVCGLAFVAALIGTYWEKRHEPDGAPRPISKS
jgi:hypothetical protein